MAGTVLVYKILGAASFDGEDLDDIYELGQYILKGMGTVGISMLSPGPAPGAPRPSIPYQGEKEEEDEKEIERGADNKSIIECKDLIKRLLDGLKKHETIK